MPEHQQTQQPKKTNTIFQKQATPISQTPASNPFSIIQRAKINPKSLTYADVMQLQRTIGNRAVGILLTGIGKTSTVQKTPVQRQEIPAEEETCSSCMQRQEIPEEEEPLQGKMAETMQRQEIPEKEEPLQGKMIGTVQRQEIPEEEEPLQGKMIETIQRQEIPEEEEPLQTKRGNNTGIPDNLKAGVESLSGIDMSDVRVHYNSSKPAEVGALAYTQGTNIHVAPGQERHLPHESWHVVQQAQGRVQPTMKLNGVAINNEEELENESDVMGAKSLQLKINADSLVNRKRKQSFITASSKIAVREKNVVQLSHESVDVPYNSSGLGGQEKTARWAISDDLNVEMRIKIYTPTQLPPMIRIHTPGSIPGSQQHMTVIRHISQPNPIHQTQMIRAEADETLIGGVTYIGYSNTIDSVTETFDLVDREFHPTQIPHQASTHAEKHFMPAVRQKIQQKNLAAIQGIIIEIRQTLTPCASCQKYLNDQVEQIRVQTRLPVTIRASAQKLSQGQPGPLGRSLHSFFSRQRSSHGQINLPIDDSPLSFNYFGVHKILPPGAIDQ